MEPLADNRPSLTIGPHRLAGRVLLAPMAGVTDRPFRQLCRRHGAALAASEMLTSDQRLWQTRKSSSRLDFEGETGPVAVQIAGADPALLASAAAACEERGVDIVDINMGCPAKKVCQALAGSALLEDEALVRKILAAVVAAVSIPVTLKIRTGPDPARRNAPTIARIAEDSGIAALAVHGRTRADRFRGEAEHETLATVRQQISIPLIANGDLSTPQQAAETLRQTGADAVMLGRAAQGNPWIFAQMNRFLDTGQTLPPPGREAIGRTMVEHLEAMHRFHGEAGVRIARKHIGWYLRRLPDTDALRRELMTVTTAAEQLDRLAGHFNQPASQAA